MSEALVPPRLHFARMDPALALAPVFLSLPTGQRGVLDVARDFAGCRIRWHGPEMLDIADQSTLLTLLCLAPQREIFVVPEAPGAIGSRLLEALRLTPPSIGFRLTGVETTWKELLLARGYRGDGGKDTALLRASLNRLASTTVDEGPLAGAPLTEDASGGTSSRLLSWLVTEDGGLFALFNPRATRALWKGGQHARISLIERRMLSTAGSQALHAWFSGSLRPGAAKSYALQTLHKHVWPGEVAGSAVRRRTGRVRDALQEIGALPGWTSRPVGMGLMEVGRGSSPV